MSSLVGYTLQGEAYYAKNIPDTMQKLFSEFISRDPEFVSKLKRVEGGWFNTRPFIANSPEEIYPSYVRYRDQLIRRAEKWRLDNGQYIDTQLGFAEAKKRIKAGCKIVGLQYRADLILREQ